MKPEKQIGKGNTGRLFTADAMRQRGGQPACEAAKGRAHGRRQALRQRGRQWIVSAALFSLVLLVLLCLAGLRPVQSPVSGGLASGIAAIGWAIGRCGG